MTRGLITAVVIALVAGAPFAVARGDEPSPELLRSRALNDQATHALDAGDLTTALARYQEAYRAYPSAKLRFNLGLVLDRLGRAAEAADELEAFLADSADVPESARAFAQKRLAALEPKTAMLSVRCGVPGAHLTVDGATRDCDRRLHYAPAEHALLVQAPGYVDLQRTLSLEVGVARELVVQLVLAPPRPEVQVDTPLPPPPPPRALRPAAIATGVLGVGALAAGVGLRVSAQLDYDHFSSTCAPFCSMSTVEAKGMHPREIAGDALLAVGGVAVGVDVVLWILDWRARRGGRR